MIARQTPWTSITNSSRKNCAHNTVAVCWNRATKHFDGHSAHTHYLRIVLLLCITWICVIEKCRTHRFTNLFPWITPFFNVFHFNDDFVFIWTLETFEVRYFHFCCTASVHQSKTYLVDFFCDDLTTLVAECLSIRLKCGYITPTLPIHRPYSPCIATFVCCIVCERMCWLNLLVINDAFVCDGLKYFSWEDKVTRTFFFCLPQLHRVWVAVEIELVRLVNTCLFEIDGKWGTNSRLLFHQWSVAGKINSSLPVTVLLFCCTWANLLCW